jgi:hypothetical protein
VPGALNWWAASPVGSMAIGRAFWGVDRRGRLNRRMAYIPID